MDGYHKIWMALATIICLAFFILNCFSGVGILGNFLFSFLLWGGFLLLGVWFDPYNCLQVLFLMIGIFVFFRLLPNDGFWGSLIASILVFFLLRWLASLINDFLVRRSKRPNFTKKLNEYGINLDELNEFPAIAQNAIVRRKLSNGDYSDLMMRQLRLVNDQFNINYDEMEIVNRLIYLTHEYYYNVKKIKNNYNENIYDNFAAIDEFSEHLSDLREEYSKIMVGNYGENRVANAVKGLGDVISNSNVWNDYGDGHTNRNQQDVILISQRGIFIFEVKNWTTSRYIEETQSGYLIGRDKYDKETHFVNVAQQILDHKKAIGNLLSDNLSMNRDSGEIMNNIHSLIVNANNNCRVLSHRDTIFNVSELSERLLEYPICFNPNEVAQIVHIITASQVSEQNRNHYIFNEELLPNLPLVERCLRFIHDIGQSIR